ncbi:MAG: glycosyltransferase [bacterium]|nr:glycosyltransferase [bacterium]
MMTTFQQAVIILTGLSALVWLCELLAVYITGKTMPKLAEMEETLLSNPPKISVIIPACNEAETLESSMQSRLQDTYPNLEFILIDDRSHDGTRDIARRIAERDQRVKLVCIDELPKGWLGKVHALHRGVRESSGDWLLFSDADVHFKPGTMNLVMNYCQTHQLAHLSVLPEFYPAGLWVDMAVSVFIKALLVVGRSWKIKDPNSRASAGAGAFNFVRRGALEQTKGFEWLKMEVIDDLTLGQMIKRAGFHSDMVNGRGVVGLHWYSNFRDMKTGVGRALFAGIGNFRPTQLLILGSAAYVIDMMPYVALIPMGIPYLQAVGAAVTLLALWVSVKTARLTNIGTLPALLLPIGNTIVFILTIRAGIVGAIKGGITWRGTFYASKELRKGRRITF